METGELPTLHPVPHRWCALEVDKHRAAGTRVGTNLPHVVPWPSSGFLRLSRSALFSCRRAPATLEKRVKPLVKRQPVLPVSRCVP